MSEIRYIVDNINNLSLLEKENICKILIIFDVKIKQNNNGVYIFTKDLDNDLIKLIYNSIKSKLNKYFFLFFYKYTIPLRWIDIRPRLRRGLYIAWGGRLRIKMLLV